MRMQGCVTGKNAKLRAGRAAHVFARDAPRLVGLLHVSFNNLFLAICPMFGAYSDAICCKCQYHVKRDRFLFIRS